MKYLGIDWGMKRVGLAVSDGELADPLKVLEVVNYRQILQDVKTFVKTEGVEEVVVGLPEGEMGKVVQNVKKDLEKLGLKVNLADETLSSQNALSGLIATGASQKSRHAIDAHSAALILQQYLDDHK
jgi:putative Holliday junction resolvase